MKEEHKCPIDGCNSTFFTEVGLNFHIKSKHGETPKTKPKPIPKKAKPTPKSEKVAKEKVEKKEKEKRLSATEYEKLAKDLSAKLWKKRIKSMRKSMATVKVGDKLTKAELIKIVGDAEDLSVDGSPPKRFSDRVKKQKFTITKVKKMKNEWQSFYAESPSQRLVWKEGPVKGKHYVTIPIIVKK
tara:strand:- start:1364 stop:1918 length:555 start_codon:yes stop_codon:yes gene_type:complete